MVRTEQLLAAGSQESLEAIVWCLKWTEREYQEQLALSISQLLCSSLLIYRPPHYNLDDLYLWEAQYI